MNSIISLIATIRQRLHDRNQDYVSITYTPPEDELYPMVLKHGHITVERDETYEYIDSTAIINTDRSLTITHNGEIVGWHDTDTYWKVSSH